MRGYDVLVADCDPQKSTTNWMSRLGGQNFKATCWQGFTYGEHVATQLANQAPKYDIIVVDCAPSVEQKTTWGALLVSSLVLIPTRLNMQDLMAVPAAKRMVRKAWDTIREKSVERGLTPPKDFPARVVATAARLHLPDEQKALDSLRKDTEIPLSNVTLGDRRAYPKSMLYGSSVHAVPKADDSVREVDALADEVLALIGLPAQRGSSEERLAA
jgi:chromosome partitioning protein